MKVLGATMVSLAILGGWHALAELPADLPHLPDISDISDLADGAQARSLTGEALHSPAPDRKTLDRLKTAKKRYEEDRDDADNIIWYGRRTAYTGDYRGAIQIFSEGIEKFPNDARMLRHRGHRYISIRELDRAIVDLEHATALIEGKENEIEPDGLPNALNIPISSLHGNIWYHLGLAYYLKHDWERALRGFQAGFEAGRNDDNRVSTTHWIYMILRRMGEDQAAAKALETISTDMKIIENEVYYELCLFYKGELALEVLTRNAQDNPTGAAGAYGIANWYYYNGNEEEASRRLRALLTTDGWASFGYTAAEADLAAR